MYSTGRSTLFTPFPRSLRGSHSELCGSHKVHTADDDQQLVSALNREIQRGDWARGIRSTYDGVADLPLTPLTSSPSDLLFLGVRDSFLPNRGSKPGKPRTHYASNLSRLLLCGWAQATRILYQSIAKYVADRTEGKKWEIS